MEMIFLGSLHIEYPFVDKQKQKFSIKLNGYPYVDKDKIWSCSIKIKNVVFRTPSLETKGSSLEKGYNHITKFMPRKMQI